MFKTQSVKLIHRQCRLFLARFCCCIYFSFRAEFSATVSPYILYDFFSKKDKEANEEKDVESKPSDKKDNSTTEAPLKDEKDIEKKLLVSAKIVERMVNLNTYDDIARDFRFYEDPADEFKNPEGSLLPLWTFSYESETNLEATFLMWSPKYVDLFAVSFGSFDFYNQPSVGYLCLFSLKNPSYPEYVCQASSGVMCLDIHPKCAHIVVVGLYDGNVAVYNLKSESSSPSYTSSAQGGKHKDVVWQVKWVEDNLDGYLNFFSISGDGRVTNWTIVKTTLWHTDKMVLDFKKSLTNSENLSGQLVEGPRCIAFKPDEENLFLVGTDEGDIYLATTEYSTAYLMTYESHKSPVNTIMWNPFYPTVFISCAAEYTVHIWHKDFPRPILRFDLGSQVGDIAWAPYSSTVFGAVTQDGRVVIFDLSVNKYNPICNQVSGSGCLYCT